MKALLFFVILTHSFGCLAQTVHTYDFVKIENGLKAEFLFYYQNNWKKLRTQAVERGYIEGFSMLKVTEEHDVDYDLALITVYANNDQYKNREVNFQKVISSFQGKIDLLNDKKPDEFRKVVGESNFISILD